MGLEPSDDIVSAVTVTVLPTFRFAGAVMVVLVCVKPEESETAFILAG